MKLINQHVKEVKDSLPKAKGAYGRRHISRGLTGFYDRTQSKRRPCVELVGPALQEWLAANGMEQFALTEES